MIDDIKVPPGKIDCTPEMDKFGITNADMDWYYKQDATVPCNGCTTCCRDELVFLNQDDQPRLYAGNINYFKMANGEVRAALKHKENGECVYLNESTCEIYEHRPKVCRHYDCRFEFITGPVTQDDYAKRRLAEGEKRVGSLPKREKKIAKFLRSVMHKLSPVVQAKYR